VTIRAEFGMGEAEFMASTEREPIIGVWGQRPWLMGQAA